MYADTWGTLDTEPQRDGTVGGDGAAECWSARWGKRNSDGTFALITSYYYPVDMRERYGDDDEDQSRFGDTPFDVELQVEFLICTDPADPGSSETWSNYEYDNALSLKGFPTLETADEAAKRLCVSALENFDRDFSWDGSPNE